MTADPIAPLATALDGTDRLVDGVRADQWDAPTPCTDWTVRQLVNHLVGGQRLVTRVLRGEPLPDPVQLGRRAGEDQLGDDPVGAFGASAAGLLDAFRAPGVLERTHTIPAGTLPGPAVLHVRVIETLVHGWDLATATGQPSPFPTRSPRVSWPSAATCSAGCRPGGRPSPRRGPPPTTPRRSTGWSRCSGARRAPLRPAAGPRRRSRGRRWSAW